jgi:hypothetical protein
MDDSFTPLGVVHGPAGRGMVISYLYRVGIALVGRHDHPA